MNNFVSCMQVITAHTKQDYCHCDKQLAHNCAFPYGMDNGKMLDEQMSATNAYRYPALEVDSKTHNFTLIQFNSIHQVRQHSSYR